MADEVDISHFSITGITFYTENRYSEDKLKKKCSEIEMSGESDKGIKYQ